MNTQASKLSEETGLTHECGVFGCIATGEWPTELDIAQIIYLGLVALQHRYVTNNPKVIFIFKYQVYLCIKISNPSLQQIF